MVRFGIGNRREILSYQAQQVRPVVQEGMEKMAPTIGKAAASVSKEVTPIYGEIAKEVTKGIRNGLNEEDKMYCKHCGKLIDRNSKFCKECGKEQ